MSTEEYRMVKERRGREGVSAGMARRWTTREGAGEGSAGGGVEQKWHPRKNKKREGAGMQTEKNNQLIEIYSCETIASRDSNMESRYKDDLRKRSSLNVILLCNGGFPLQS